MTNQIEIVRESTLKFRGTLLNFFKAVAPKADVIPAGWKNNFHWHLGHLIVTPNLLTHRLLNEKIAVNPNYKTIFAKDTSPMTWTNIDVIPPYEQLLEEFIPSTEALFESMTGRMNHPFAVAYTTSPGVVLETPLHALNFSQTHDGIHMGLMIALRRSLH